MQHKVITDLFIVLSVIKKLFLSINFHFILREPLKTN